MTAAAGLRGGRREIGRVAAATFGDKAGKVGLPEVVLALADVVEVIPGIQAAVVAVGEHRANRVVADGLDTGDATSRLPS